MKLLAVLASLFVLFAAPAFAINTIYPVSAEITQGSQISVGDVGPGQTFAVSVEPMASTGGKYGIGGAYDKLSASKMPYGWASTPSKLYGSPLQADITVPKDASDGEYTVEMSLWDEAGAEGLGENLTFIAKVKVTKEVMDMKVEPSYISVGAGQPARYTITVVNKGIANDIFTIGSSGVRNWEFRRAVYIQSGTSKTITYEIAGDDEADYKVNIWARSSSSDAISSNRDVSLRVNTDLFSDYRAVNHGVLLFPTPVAPLYFMAGLLSNLLPA
ncbi:MAG: hypothetical protein WCT52_01155 [Candidatus Micrarchaeia archaeon]